MAHGFRIKRPIPDPFSVSSGIYEYLLSKYGQLSAVSNFPVIGNSEKIEEQRPGKARHIFSTI